MNKAPALLRAALVVAAAALTLGPGLGRASAATPPGFFGVVPQGGLTAADFARMDGVVGTLRVPFYWSRCESERGSYDFTELDAVVGAAAAHGIRILPFVYGTPPWLATDAARPPLDSAAARGAWSRYLRRLVERYGPGGEFWKGSAGVLPIRRWQIWNEPNFRLFWQPHPEPRRYARLLGLAADAIRGADPGAKIVLGGVAPVGAGYRPWVFLRQLYRVPGVKRDFDFVALHPYSIRVANTLGQVRLAHEAIEGAGDSATPILVTELGVASGGVIPSGFVLGEAGQAGYLRRALAALVAKRRPWRIAGVDWFTWRDASAPDVHCGFCQGAGLFDLAGRAKPAWHAYRAAVRASVR
ncbi:MAG: hypothetical protein AB7T48_07325 [Solirubrobacterales bacterium]